MALLAAGIGQAWAMEPPQPGELAGYAADGTLAARVAYAKEIGNHNVDPELIAQARFNLDRQVMEAQGLDPVVAAMPPPALRGVPTTGNVKMLCLLIEFNDYRHDPGLTQAGIHSALFGAGNPAFYPCDSLTNYYKRSSYNKLNIQGNTLGWYRTPYNRSAVGLNKEGRQGLIKDAINHYEALGHDFSQYDNDGDGDVDVFHVIYAGPHDGWGGFWWGWQCEWQDWWPFDYVEVDGKRLSKYTFQFQSKDTSGGFDPTVVIHETGHALGLPDYYDYDDSDGDGVNVGPGGGVGDLDMMGGEKGDHNCFSKWILGWLTPTMVATFGSQTIPLRASGTTEDCVMIIPGASPAGQFSEYFMVQNRTKAGNDDTNNWNGSGMMIWHVNAALDIFGNNYAYNNSYTSEKLLCLMEADGQDDIENHRGGDPGDFYVTGHAFKMTGNPNSKLYNGQPSWVSVTNFTPAQFTMSALFTLVNPSGVPPVVEITSPAWGSSSPQGATVAIAATATDQTFGIPASVAFYINGALISTDTTPPYTASWIGTTVGRQALTAVATGFSGLTTTTPAEYFYVTSVNPPANDAFAGRINITGNPATVTGTNVNSSAETSEPGHHSQAPQRSVWWKWTPSITGSATITTAGSNFDTILAAYTGNAIGALTAKASNDDAEGGGSTSSITFAVTAGVQIQIAVDGYHGATGTITLNVSVVHLPPANDYFANATLIPNGAWPVTFTTTNHSATAQTGEPAHGNGGPLASVWWKWTAPSAGTLRISTSGSSFDTVLAIYTGTAVDALTLQAYSDDVAPPTNTTSEVSLTVTAGTQYFIAVDGYNGATGTIKMPAWFFDLNDPPTISLNSPWNGQSVKLNSALHIVVEAFDPESRVKEVRFYINGTLAATRLPNPGVVTFETDPVMNTAGYRTITATAEDHLGLTASASVTVLVSSITLPEALNNVSLPWASGGTQSWSGTAAKSHDGVSSAVSGTLGDAQQSWFSTAVSGPGNIACWWSVSSESGYDYLRFYIDGIRQDGEISGEVGWTQKSWNVPAGNHTLKWQYEKDGSREGGADAAWVDQVVWLTPPVLAGASSVTAPTTVPLSYALSANVSVTTYSVASGPLPDGMALNPATGEVTGTPTVQGTFNVTFQGTNAAGSGTKAVTFNIFAALPIPVSVETPPLIWTTGGDSKWYGESTTTHDGTDAIQSGPIKDFQSVWAQTHVTGPGTLRFWWKVSSEAGYDYLQFYLDGAEQVSAAKISGLVDWQQIAVAIPAGTHALRWTYSRDQSVSSGMDAAWLDQVVFAPTLPQALDTPALNWVTTSNAPWGGQILTTHDGVDAAQSGVISDLQLTSAEIQVTGAGSLSFWWKVSSELNYDYLQFFMDGVRQPGITDISGEVDWQQKTLAVPAGNHTLKWVYTKDNSNIAGADAAWLDQVVFTPFNFTAPGTTAGRSAWRRPDAGAPPTDFPRRRVTVPYDAMRFKVSTTGTYTLTSTAAAWRNFLFLYSTAFDPASPLEKVLLGSDDSVQFGTASFTTTLNAGTTYYLVTSGLQNDDSGAYTLDISGPGSVEVTLAVPGTTAGRPTWQRPDQNGPNPPVVLSTEGTAVPYDAVAFTVSVSGNYSMKNTGAGPWDNYLLHYADGFDPAHPLAKVLIGNDDFPIRGVAGFSNITLYAGTTYFLVTTGFQNYHSGKYTLEITGPGRPQADNALENWRLTWFGNNADSGNGADDNDYDNDGSSNLLEFAFGLNPTLASTGLVPRMQMAGANFTVTFTEPDGVSGITYGAEWSTTMQPASWISIPDAGVAPQHTFTIPMAANPELFLRLKITAP
jgi:M6 family metalloprotease-like protein